MPITVRVNRAARALNYYAHTAKHKTLTWTYDNLRVYLKRQTISRSILVSVIEALWDCPSTVDVTWDGESITVRVM